MPTVPGSHIPQERWAERTLQGPRRPHRWCCPPQALVEIKGWNRRGGPFGSTEKDATDKLSWIQELKPQGSRPHRDDRRRAVATRGAERRYPPLLAVLPHAHAAPVPRGGVAAWPLPHLEADATRGAAGGPRGPGGPASVPGGRSDRSLRSTCARPNLHPPPASHRGSPTGTAGRQGPGSKEPWESRKCAVSEPQVPGSPSLPPNLIFESKEKTRESSFTCTCK